MQNVIEAGRSIGLDLDSGNVHATSGNAPRRVRLIDNGRSKDGWLYVNIVGGKYVAFIGNWKTGEKVEVKSRGGFDGISKAELAAIRGLREKAEAEQKRVWAESAMKATEYFENLPECPKNHPYLEQKKIAPNGAKFDEEDGSLVVPVYNLAGQTSWQKIWSKSQQGGRGKLFLKGGKKKGCLYRIEGINSQVVYVCEGFATGCSIHAATGCEVFVAFDAGNLQPVIDSIREFYGNKIYKLIVAADNDHQKEENAGIKFAQATGESFVFPEGIDGSDFNDMHCELGLEAAGKKLVEATFPKIEVKSIKEIEHSSLTTKIPEHILKPGGLISEGIEALSQPGLTGIDQYSYPVVMAVLSRAIAGRIMVQGVWPNVYNIKVGPTSSGKSESDKDVKNAFAMIGQSDFVGITDIASGQGLMRALSEKPQTLIMIDEVAGLFRAGARKDPISEGKKDALMEIYSASGSKMEKAYSNTKNVIKIDEACLTLVGNCTSNVFEALTMDDFESGILPRFDFWCYDGLIPYRGIKQKENPKLDNFVRGAAKMRKNTADEGQDWKVNEEIVDLELGSRAKECLEDYSRSIIDKANDTSVDPIHKGLISRGYHLALKYAMIHSAGTRALAEITEPLSLPDIEYGIEVSGIIQSWKIDVLTSNITTGDFHRDCKIFIDAISAAMRSKQRPTFNRIARRRRKLLDWKKQHSEQIIEILHKRGEIIIDESGRKTAYFLSG